jgi:hypothetical protein
MVSLNRNDAAEVWVEQATGLFWRAARPPVRRAQAARIGEALAHTNFGGKLPPNPDKLAGPVRVPAEWPFRSHPKNIPLFPLLSPVDSPSCFQFLSFSSSRHG